MSTNNESAYDDDDDVPSHWPSHKEASRSASTTTSTSEVDQDLDDIDLDDTNTITSSSSSSSHLPSSSLLPASSSSSSADNAANAKDTKNNTNINNSERKTTTTPISLAVAADVSQAPIPENASSDNHARGGAVALHLSSLLSHISSNGNNITSLSSELNPPPPPPPITTTREKDDLTKKHDWNNFAGVKTPDNEKAAARSSPPSSSSSPPPQKEFVFKRMVHAIDNYFHPPSKLLPHLHFKSPRHHMQGHRLTSTHNNDSDAGHASSSSSNHACTMNSLPNCQACQACHVSPHNSIQEHQHQNQQEEQRLPQEPRNAAHKEQQKHNHGFLHVFENHYKYGSIRFESATPHPHHRQRTVDTARSRQQQQQHDGKKQPVDETQPSVPTRSTRRLPTFAALSTTVASAFAPNNSPTTTTATATATSTHDNSQTTTATNQPPPITKQSKSFFPFSFHSSGGASSRPKSPHRSSSHRRSSGPLLYGTSDHDEHDAAITTALYVCKLYQMGQDVTRSLHKQNGSGKNGGSDIDDVRVGEETSGNEAEGECIVGDSAKSRSGASGKDGQNLGSDIDDVRDDESSGNEEEGGCIVGDSAKSRSGGSDIDDAREGKTSGNGEEGERIVGDSAKGRSDGFDHRARHALFSLGFEFRLDTENCSADGNNNCKTDGKENGPTTTEGNTNCKSDEEYGHCAMCSDDRVTRLYHVPSNTAVTNANRRTFIADGKMFDAVAHVCQAAAQEIMAEKCNLAWVTVCDGKGGGLRAEQRAHYSSSNPRSNSVEEWPRDERGDIVIREPIRALVGREQPFDHDGAKDRPRDTFLVVTGKGKVRAGIFSRTHLMTTGLEPSTALPLLCEARGRGMNCVVIDPNARGDRFGMDTFETSIRGLFEGQGVLKEEESDGDNNDEGIKRERAMRAIIPVEGAIYVLAHSAAGGQLVRYLLDQQKDAPLLSRIRCITFTDSTHSIQWLKHHPHISTLIQSSKALYVRSANRMRDDDWENASPGDECPKDHFWSHRFGDIKTVWAGTTEHSLSNWTAHKLIWDHFDEIRGQTKDYFAERNGRTNNIDFIDKKDHDVMMTDQSLNNGNSQANEKRMSRERVHIGTNPVII